MLELIDGAASGTGRTAAAHSSKGRRHLMHCRCTATCAAQPQQAQQAIAAHHSEGRWYSMHCHCRAACALRGS